MSPLLRIIGLWRRQAVYLCLGIALSLAALAAGIALMASSAQNLGLALLGAGLAAPLVLQITGAARVVLRYAERVVAHDAMFRALAAVRIWFFRGLADSAAGGLGLRHAGDVLARLVNDVEAMDGLYLRLTLPLLGAILLVPVLAYVLLRENFIAVLALLPFCAVAFYLPWRAANLARASGGRIGLAMGGLRRAALDTLSGLREVKIFAAEGRMLAAIQSREAELLAAQRDLVRESSKLNVLAFGLGQLAILLALLLGFVATGAVVTLVAVLVLVAAFEAVSALPRAGLLFGQASSAAGRVVAAAETPPPVADPVVPAALPASYAIAFEHVGFRYAPDLPYLFETLSLQLPAGSRTAIIGPSGAGKSTIAALLLKLAMPESGHIRLGGADLAALPAEAVRSRIAYLSQNTHLFADTVRNNLLLGDPAASDARLWEALETAQLGDVIRALPDGLDGWVGEGGNTLSGGQGRRLALARTLLSHAPILLLDEPCAGLDATAEAAFMRALNAGAQGRTVVLILHKLTGTEQLDRIWRLAGGTLMAATG